MHARAHDRAFHLLSPAIGIIACAQAPVHTYMHTGASGEPEQMLLRPDAVSSLRTLRHGNPRGTRGKEGNKWTPDRKCRAHTMHCHELHFQIPLPRKQRGDARAGQNSHLPAPYCLPMPTCCELQPLLLALCFLLRTEMIAGSGQNGAVWKQARPQACR